MVWGGAQGRLLSRARCCSYYFGESQGRVQVVRRRSQCRKMYHPRSVRCASLRLVSSIGDDLLPLHHFRPGPGIGRSSPPLSVDPQCTVLQSTTTGRIPSPKYLRHFRNRWAFHWGWWWSSSDYWVVKDNPDCEVAMDVLLLPVFLSTRAVDD